MDPYMCKQMGECEGRGPKARQERSSEESWRREAAEQARARSAAFDKLEAQRIRLEYLKRGRKPVSLWARVWRWLCSR